MTRRFICLGHATIDRVYQVEHLPTVPTKMRAHAFSEVGGGMAANAACAMSRLLEPGDGSIALWGRAGDDTAGVFIRNELLRYGVDATAFRLFPGCISSQTAVMVDAAGERMIINFRGNVPLDDISWIDFGTIAGAAAVLTDVRWRDGATAMLTAARRFGVPSVLDADLGELAIKNAVIPLADHVVFSEPGLIEWCGHDDHERALRDAAARGARIAAVTCGAKGSYFLIDGCVHHVPAQSVAVVDTLGAGDVFHGAYALAIGEGNTVLDAARFASAAAAIKCTRHGGRTGAPGRAEVMELLRR
ncbi:MAG: PfkB family carbohydrate kinase [Betaproteobacteria bacterium]